MTAMEDFIRQTGADLWIQHDAGAEHVGEISTGVLRVRVRRLFLPGALSDSSLWLQTCVVSSCRQIRV